MSATLPPKLGRYQVVDALGKGAMGVVYLAKDPLIGRLVALKTFRGIQASDDEMEEARERFIREAQSAGILSHPNIVTIHDVVEHSDEGLTFIAMEYVRGTDLKEMLRRDEVLDLPTIADIIWQVAQALEYAHSKGVVHRDIKPANILLTADQRVKLTDFGIARLASSNLTHSGQLLGTPNYMAPEQIQGKDVDHRADIFSLGVVLYELLTRKKPFQGENLTVVTHRIINEPFTPPEEYVGELPASIKAVLGKALAKQPAERYHRVGELAVELKKAVEQVEAEESKLNDTQDVVAEAPAAPPSPPEAATQLIPIVPVAPPPEPEAPAAPLEALPALELPPIPEPAPKPATAPIAVQRPAVADDKQKRRRLIAILGGLGVVAVIAVGIVLAMSSGSSQPAAPAKPAPVVDTRILVSKAEALLAKGDFAAALSAIAEVERYDPGSSHVAELRRRAEEGSRAQLLSVYNDEQVGAFVTVGEKALAEGRPAEAAAAARRALEMAPGDARAADLLRRAEAATRSPGSRQGAPAPSPAHTTPVVPAPATSTAAEAPTTAPAPAAPAAAEEPVVGDAQLRIAFFTERPQGVLTVYADKRQLLRESFRYSEKSGFMRSKGTSGSLERQVTIPAGPATLRVLVVLDKTEVETVQGNFRPGATRTLEIRVSADGIVRVTLR
ncbi:MAG TPA: serine/threonine-protein kinase [Thermoanaerobaculia bacterium]|nr:serine/threonine-protein kinase [Thermoanaerobaculia bacterium]